MTTSGMASEPSPVDPAVSAKALSLVTPEVGATTRAASRRRLHVSSGWVLLLSDVLCLMLPSLVWGREIIAAMIATAATVWLFRSADLYRPKLQAVMLDQLPTLVGRMLAAIGFTVVVLAVLGDSPQLERFLGVMLVGAVLMIAGRVAVFACVRFARRNGRARHRTIIIGSGVLAERIATSLEHGQSYGLEVVGYVDNTPGSSQYLDEAGYLGGIPNLRSTVDAVEAKVLIVAEGSFTTQQVATELRSTTWSDMVIFVVPRYYQATPQPTQGDMIGAVPVTRLTGRTNRRFQMACKRIIDVVACSIALLIIWPLMAVIAILVRLDGGPGIIFHQQRVGHDGDLFVIPKFRTMTPADETESATQWSIADDERVTRIGRLLRKTSLDELPQIWTILRGDMTIVGPRPERPHFAERFARQQPDYIFRLRVPAGLTGLAQVNGLRGDTSISERAELDNYYIENWSLWLDAKIIVRTITQVLLGRGG